MNRICLTTHPISGVEIDRTYELLDVLEFHIKQHDRSSHNISNSQTQSKEVFGVEIRRKLENCILNKLHSEEQGEYLLSFEAKPKFFKGVYPSLFPTSDKIKSSLEFYNSLLTLMTEVSSRQPSYSIYGCLYRLEGILKHETNLDQLTLAKLVGIL